ASKEFAKGRPKNYLTKENIKRIEEIYKYWQEVENLSRIISLEEVINNDYNLSPSRYVTVYEKEGYIPIRDVLDKLAEIEKEKIEIDNNLKNILKKLRMKL
ncbi:unnamed protein product, partial [marine sediment metagenome]